MEATGAIPNTHLTTGNRAAQEISHRGRTLVLCFDGTAGQYDNENSNVVKLFGLLTKDPNEQLCYYQPGVGTWFKPGAISPLLSWGAKILDRAIAWYLDQHVLDGYKFIMQNYQAGDKVCLFGFSRGAYTARALAGMLHKVGLLPRDNDVQMGFAYKLYQREDEEGLRCCEGFKRTYCQNVQIEFVGVWDTVAAVGLIASRTLPFTNSNTSVKTFRHALSLDERRARYRANLYHRMSQKFEDNAKKDTEFAVTSNPPSKSSTGLTSGSSSSDSSDGSSKQQKSVLERQISTTIIESPKVATKEEKARAPTFPTPVSDDVLEVWFTGAHSDVGGGSVHDEEERSLSHISLRWMVRQVAASGCGVKFDAAALAWAKITIEPSNLEGEIDPLDRLDATAKVYDKLKIKPFWWILEVLPMSYVWQDKNGIWRKTFKWHLGRGRTIESHKPQIHESVKIRQEQMDYKPKARWEEGSETYVR
ncbi:hypothetical protein FA13DRAFT_1808407 [Coprinellus micaceus]|uniref:T6SS Phospholipase effector Tle1-like catalytic domain-containing protein n=1 Tax=Coprinellus micaceus TaxID=71717 RepID=A0A4Y7U131_COPMI|nr:hypothetical protein FA13DRAFT_1808407 [Coprinellus micaceus]